MLEKLKELRVEGIESFKETLRKNMANDVMDGHDAIVDALDKSLIAAIGGTVALLESDTEWLCKQADFKNGFSPGSKDRDWGDLSVKFYESVNS